jgi:hypothetical protein
VAGPDTGAVIAAARGLIRAAQWELADRLLAAAAPADAAGRAAIALHRARIAVELRQWRGEGDPAPALATAEAAASGQGEDAILDLELLRLFSDYWAELMPADRPPQFGPDPAGRDPAGRDPAVLAGLRDRASRLAARTSSAATGTDPAAPARRRAARAAFYAGLVADNLCGETERAEVLFAESLAWCRPHADDDYAAEALRHLGGSAQAAGDLSLARQRWQQSAELAQRAGWLPLALAQHALLAELSAQEGDGAGAAALAREVHRWAAAQGLRRLAAQAAATASAGTP